MPLSAQGTRRSFSNDLWGSGIDQLAMPTSATTPSPNVTQPMKDSPPGTKIVRCFDLAEGDELINLIRWKSRLAVLKEAFVEGLLPADVYKHKMEALVQEL
jgi:hypothetical protein